MSPPRIGVDPSLPCVAPGSLTCPHCGQTYETISEGETALPEQHYVRPTVVTWSTGTRTTVRSTSSASHRTARTSAAVCPVESDTLVTLIFRAQRELAGLSAPRLAAS